MDTTDDEEQVLTKDHIDADKPYHSASVPIDTDKPSPISKVPVVDTRAPVEIVTRVPIDEQKTPFQPIITTFFQVLKYLLVYHQFLYQGNHHQ